MNCLQKEGIPSWDVIQAATHPGAIALTASAVFVSCLGRTLSLAFKMTAFAVLWMILKIAIGFFTGRNVIIHMAENAERLIDRMREPLTNSTGPHDIEFSKIVRRSYSRWDSVLLVLDNFDKAMQDPANTWKPFLEKLVRDCRNSRTHGGGLRAFNVAVVCKSIQNAYRICAAFPNESDAMLLVDSKRTGAYFNVMACNTTDDTAVTDYQSEIGRFRQF